MTPEEQFLHNLKRYVQQHDAAMQEELHAMKLQRIEAQLRGSLLAVQKMVQDARVALEDTSRRVGAECFYRFLDEPEVEELVHSDIVEFAHAALAHSAQELGLQHLPLRLTWFDEPSGREHQSMARMLWEANKPVYFRERRGLRGFVYWNSVLDSNTIYVNARLGRKVMGTVAHECRHVWQRLQHGEERPTDVDLEADAEAYGESVWDKLRWIYL